jgi:hypothetical protein
VPLLKRLAPKAVGSFPVTVYPKLVKVKHRFGATSRNHFLHDLHKLELHERLQQSRNSTGQLGGQFVVSCCNYDG